MTRVRATVLNPGEAQGPVLALTEPVSFWGAYDPVAGTIVDVHHPQRGCRLTGHVVLLRETRGSGGTPGGIAEAIRLATAPAGIVLASPDINLAIGAATAAELYGRHCPVLLVTPADYDRLARLPALAIDRDGTVYPV